MRVPVFFLVAAAVWATPQQITINSTNKATVTLPGSAPYSTLATFRVDWRVTVSASAPNSPAWDGYNQIFWSLANGSSFSSGYLARIYGISNGTSFTGFSFLINSFQDSPSVQMSCPNLSFGQDTVLRVQKWPTYMTCETWNIDGSNYQETSTLNQPFRDVPGISGILQIGNATSTEGTLAFFRGYAGNVALNSKPPFGSIGGDLWDYEFNGNLNDSSGHNLTLSPTRTFSYSAAATFAPACVLPPPATFRAGTPVTALTATNSYPLDGGQTLTYVWQQIPGNVSVSTLPLSVLQFSSQTAINPTVQGLVAGSYTIQLTVKDGSGQSSTCSTKYGAVATDANGSVIISNPVHAQILGPMTAIFASPWAAEPQQHIAYSQLVMQKMAGTSTIGTFWFIDYWNQPLSGTVSVAAGSQMVTGAGTSFTTQFCQGPSNPTVPKHPTSTAIAIWYPILNPDGNFSYPTGTTGRRFGGVASCIDDTHMMASFPTSDGNWQTSNYVGAGSGLSYAYVETQCGNLPPTGVPNCAGIWNFNAAPADFYDNVVALYALYYRTGLDDYLVAARTLADRWWSYPSLDKGISYETSNRGNPWGVIPPYRAIALTGLFMRNADNPPYDYGPGLRSIVSFLTGSGTPRGSLFANCNVGPRIACGQDVRENGYALKFVAQDYLYNSGPNGVSPNPAQAANDLTAVSGDMTNRWGICQSISSTSDGLCRQVDTIDANQPGFRAGWSQGGGNFAVTVAGNSVIAQGSGTFIASDFSSPMVITSASATNPMTLTFTSSPPFAPGTSIGIIGATGTGCSIMNGAQTVAGVSGNNMTIYLNGTGCSYTASSATAAQPTAIWFTSTGTTSPVSNLQGDPTFFYVNYVDPKHLALVGLDGTTPVSYSGAQTGSAIGWQVLNPANAQSPNYLGWYWQPYMTGILNSAYKEVSRALATSDPVNAENAVTWALNNAVFVATIGLDTTVQGGFVTNGPYYVVGIGCPGNRPQPTYAGYSLGVGCEEPVITERELNSETLNVATIALQLNPTSNLALTLGQTMAAAMYAQPGETGYDGTNILSDLVNPGFLYTTFLQHKWLGAFWGVGANWSWTATRLGGLNPPILRVVQVALDFQTASQAVLTVLRPDGTSSQVTCTSSPCPITIDSREGDHLLSIKYLSPSNQVLLPAEQTVVKAQ